MRFKGLGAIIIGLIFCISLATAIPQDSHKFYGTATSANVGNILVAYINSVASGNITITTAGQYGCFDSTGVLLTCSDGATSNVLSVTGTTGDSILFKVGTTTCGSATLVSGDITRKNLDCSVGGVSPGTTGATGGGGTAGGAGGAAVAPPRPTETLTDVTNPSVISDIRQSLPAGWANVNIQQVDTTTSKSTTASIGIVDNALSFATDPDAISALQNLKNSISSGESTSLSVTSTLSIFKVTNKDTGEIEYRSQIHLIFSAPFDMKDIKVIETIPKEMASSINDIIFIEKPTNILQEDPVVEWIISTLSKGETKDLSYVIKKKITEIKSITTAAGKKVEVVAPPPPVEKPKPKIFTTEVIIGISVMILIVLIGLLIYFAVTRKKEETR